MMALRALVVFALALAAFAVPTSTEGPYTTYAIGKRESSLLRHLKNFRPGIVFRQVKMEQSKPKSPFAEFFSQTKGAPSMLFHPTNLFPRGVMYDPFIGFSHEGLQVRDSPGGPIRVVEEDEVDIHATLRKMKTHVPGDPLQDHMPVLSHQVDMTDAAAVRQSTDVVRINGPKSSYKLVLDANMPQAPRDAFSRAVSTWSKVFPSPVEIRIRFSWTDLGGSTLGATSIPFYIQGSIEGADKLDDNTVYGSVMAGALEGKDFVPESEVHIVMGFSSVVPWNTGSDDAPFGEWDLETVALHEIGHGLFFAGVMQASPRQSIADFAFRNSRPARFDRFLSNGATDSGLASCVAPKDIYDTITGSNLRFIDPNDPDNTNFGLYSPSGYTSGSSAYHLDPDAISADCETLGISASDCSDLMTQSLPNGYTQRTIGIPTERVMNAMLGGSAGFFSAQSC